MNLLLICYLFKDCGTWISKNFSEFFFHAFEFLSFVSCLCIDFFETLPFGFLFQVLFFMMFFFSAFIIGFVGGYLKKRNALIFMISLELVITGIVIGFFFFGTLYDDVKITFFILIILTVSAAESALGGAIIAEYSRATGDFLCGDVGRIKN